MFVHSSKLLMDSGGLPWTVRWSLSLEDFFWKGLGSCEIPRKWINQPTLVVVLSTYVHVLRCLHSFLIMSNQLTKITSYTAQSTRNNIADNDAVLIMIGFLRRINFCMGLLAICIGLSGSTIKTHLRRRCLLHKTQQTGGYRNIAKQMMLR